MIFYEIILSEPAEADIEAIRHRLFLRSPDAAVRFQNGVESAIVSLSQMPNRCAVAPDNNRLEHSTRQLIYRDGAAAYRILFSVFDEREASSAFVRVLRIRHGAQQALKLAADQPEDA